MKEMTIKLVGNGAMLMHSSRSTDPLDEGAQRHKAMTSKRKKTDEDHLAIMKSEWMLGLYYDKATGVYVPAANIKSSLRDGGKAFKLGKKLSQSITFSESRYPLEYDGPKDPEKMWKAGTFRDVRPVKVQSSRLMRCRPRFEGWSLTITIYFSEDRLDSREIMNAFKTAGMYAGLGDFRVGVGGDFGRYDVQEVK